MALINGLYICCEKEQLKREMSITEHPVEKGVNITDNVKAGVYELSLSGYIVDVPQSNSASTIVSKIRSYMANGKYVNFRGRVRLDNALITDFQTEYNNKVNGGCTFTMELKKVRIAKSAYTGKSKKKKSTQQITKRKSSSKRYHTVKKGETLQKISKKYYGSYSLYPTIYKANKKAIDKRNKVKKGKKKKNKYTIYPKMRLLIP